MLYYNNYVARFPDEPAQVSYIAYLQCNNSVIPEFKDMTILTGKPGINTVSDPFTVRNGYGGTLTFSSAFNYLCHPPLYYQIMRLSGGVQVTGKDTFTVDIGRLRYFSMFIAALAMLLVFYIGLSRIGKNPLFHLLYAAITISVPMLAYDCAGINNDTMALLGVTIFTLGLIRFSEKKRNWGTYVLIGSGVFVAFQSKLTAGIVVTLSLGLFLVYTFIKEKNVKFILSREFLYSVPLYLLAGAYYIIIKIQTGSFEPNYKSLSPKQFFASAHYVPKNIPTMGIRKYFTAFFSSFLYTWTGICSHVSLVKVGHFWGRNQIGLILIIILPLLIYVRSKHKNNPALPVVGVICPALVATVILQFLDQFKGFKQTGYTGGYQSRYYLCAIAAIGLAGVFAMIKLYGSKRLDDSVEKPQAANEPSVLTEPSGENETIVSSESQNASETLSSDSSLSPTAVKKLKIRHVAVNAFCVGLSALLIYEDFIYFLLNFKNFLK